MIIYLTRSIIHNTSNDIDGIVHQARPFMGFSQKENWSELPTSRGGALPPDPSI